MKLFTPRALATASGAALLGTATLVARPHSSVQRTAPKPPSILQPTKPGGRAPQSPGGETAGKPPHAAAKPVSRKPAATSGYIQRPLPGWVRGKAIGRVHVKNHERVIALTFDDGPWPVYTGAILDTLKREKVHATFFMIGRNVASHPALARRVAAEGHAIGNHTWNHPSRPRGAKVEIDRTDAILKQTLGFTPNLFRPPYGMLRNGLAATAHGEGKAVVLWSADSMDWNHASASSIYSTIMRESGPGGIALMHDGGGNRAATAAALPDIIASLKARGYRFVTVPQLLAMHVAPEPKKRLQTTGKAPVKPAPAPPIKKTAPAPTPAAPKPHVTTPHPAAPKVQATPSRPTATATPAAKKPVKPAPGYAPPKPAATPMVSKPHSVGPKPSLPGKPRKPRATAPAFSLPHYLRPQPAQKPLEPKLKPATFSVPASPNQPQPINITATGDMKIRRLPKP